MRLVRMYTTSTAHYAQIEMDDGGRVEFKRLLSVNAAMPSDADWLAMAAASVAANEPPESTVEIEAEDAVIV